MRRRLPELYSHVSQKGWGIPFTIAALLAYWALLFGWGKVCFLAFHAAFTAAFTILECFPGLRVCGFQMVFSYKVYI